MQGRAFSSIFLFAFLGIGCASTDDQDPSIEDADLSAIVEASAAQNDTGVSSGYYAELARHWTRRQLPNKGNCYAISAASILYLQIEADGTVSRVYGDPENRRSQCYRAAYTNMMLPKPPVSPFYFRLDIQ